MRDSDHLLTIVQVQELQNYFKILDKVQGYQGPEFTFDELRTMTSLYKTIQKMGQGNPYKAAYKHLKIIKRRKQREKIAEPFESDTMH